jgi:hypothetical protein
MGRFTLLNFVLVFWMSPLLSGGGVLCALELVGGVEAAAEPESAGPGEEEKAEQWPLTAGDSILVDLEMNPEDQDFEKKITPLFLQRDELERVIRQIGDLDAEDFRKRNDASRALVMVAAPIEHLLGGARRDAGAEMSRRIQGILNVRIKQRRLDALYHVAGRLSSRSLQGWGSRLGVMSSTFEPVSHWDLLRMFEIAAAECSQQQDREVFEKSLHSDSQSERELAAFVIGYRFLPGIEKSRVTDLVGDDEFLELAMARGRAAKGDAEVSKVLLQLLGSENLRVRHEAGILLRGLHDKDFGFAGYDRAGSRTEAVGRWQNYLGSLADDVILEEARIGRGARGEFMVLVATPPGKDGAVTPWTTSGRKLSKSGLAASMASIRPDSISFNDPAGLAVASGGGHEAGRVAVFTNEGKEIWSASGIPVEGGAAIMPGGRLLVAIGSEVEELDISGGRAGVWKMPSRIVSFKRLREGRFLCAHPEAGSLAEYGSKGQLLWRVEGFDHPRWVERLESGNLLVVVDAELAKEDSDRRPNAGKMRVIETSPDGKVVLSSIHPKGVNVISSAARLPNGNTLVGTEKGLAEYTPEGYAVKVWLKNVISTIHVR